MMLTLIDICCSPAIIGVGAETPSILDDSAAYGVGPVKNGVA